MQDNQCPYSDDYMLFDKTSGHYVLTEKAITEKCGVDLRAKLSANGTGNPDTVINMLLTTISDSIYAYIHEYSFYPKQKDCLIARSQHLRGEIEKAMVYQAIYVLSNGDLFVSTSASEEGKELSKLSKQILLNSGILYTGA